MSTGATRPDIPAVPTVAAEPSGAESPAPAPVERPATATGPVGGSWRERAERAEAEQARILGEQKAEWLCEPCAVIHPWRDGGRFTAACPDCGGAMVPTSISARALQEARGRAEAAEAKLAAQREYDTYRRALWVMVRQFGGSVFLTSAQMEDVPLLASLGVGREPGGIRINAGEEP